MCQALPKRLAHLIRKLSCIPPGRVRVCSNYIFDLPPQFIVAANKLFFKNEPLQQFSKSVTEALLTFMIQT